MFKYMKFLIIAHGSPLSKRRLHGLARGRFVVCLDGAANELVAAKFIPDLILGDMDGISAEARKFFERKGVPILTYGDQDTTDLEKALLYCRVRGAKSIYIAAALGNSRTDHTLANLGFLKKYYRHGCETALFTETEKIQFIRNGTVKAAKKNKTVGVFGFPKGKVTSKGLEFEMKALALELGKKESVANRTKRAGAKIQIRGEAIAVLEE